MHHQVHVLHRNRPEQYLVPFFRFRRHAWTSTLKIRFLTGGKFLQLDLMPTFDEPCQMTTQVRHKTTDAKGRVTLGGHFANRAVIVELQGDDVAIVRLARVIPEREAWLYENPKALTAVRRGLDQVRKGHVAKTPPDLKMAAKLAAQLED